MNIASRGATMGVAREQRVDFTRRRAERLTAEEQGFPSEEACFGLQSATASVWDSTTRR